MNGTFRQAAAAGAAIYSRPTLAVYDLLVITLSNQLAWRCSAWLQLDFHNQHMSANHLDVGVGTGYYLDRCRFPTRTPRLALLDLNPNSLQVAAHRLQRYDPIVQRANVLQLITWDTPPFDSIALSYVLHCLPGTMHTKQAVFDNLLPLLRPGGVVFGTSILGRAAQCPRAIADEVVQPMADLQQPRR